MGSWIKYSNKYLEEVFDILYHHYGKELVKELFKFKDNMMLYIYKNEVRTIVITNQLNDELMNIIVVDKYNKFTTEVIRKLWGIHKILAMDIIVRIIDNHHKIYKWKSLYPEAIKVKQVLYIKKLI